MKELFVDDARIIELFFSRDEAAVAEADRLYGRRLKTLALRLLGDPREAEECVNDAYLRAWELIPPADPRGYLFAFLGRIVRGLAVDRLRAASSKKRSAEVVELTKELSECLPSSADVEEAAEARELSSVIGDFIRELPEEKRFIFLRRYWYFDSIADIAASLGSGAGRIRTELYRLRRKLKAYLERKGYTV